MKILMVWLLIRETIFSRGTHSVFLKVIGLFLKMKRDKKQLRMQGKSKKGEVQNRVCYLTSIEAEITNFFIEEFLLRLIHKIQWHLTKNIWKLIESRS